MSKAANLSATRFQMLGMLFGGQRHGVLCFFCLVTGGCLFGETCMILICFDIEVVIVQGIVGCTPTNVPLWEIPI